MTIEVWRHCPDCHVERVFTPPGCADGHGLECPDLACTTCGAALLSWWGPAGTSESAPDADRHRRSAA